MIACVSSPIDVIGPGTPPINTTPDKIPFEWMVVVVSVVLIAGCCAGAIVFRKLGGQE